MWIRSLWCLVSKPQRCSRFWIKTTLRNIQDQFKDWKLKTDWEGEKWNIKLIRTKITYYDNTCMLKDNTWTYTSQNIIWTCTFSKKIQSNNVVLKDQYNVFMSYYNTSTTVKLYKHGCWLVKQPSYKNWMCETKRFFTERTLRCNSIYRHTINLTNMYSIFFYSFSISIINSFQYDSVTTNNNQSCNKKYLFNNIQYTFLQIMIHVNIREFNEMSTEVNYLVHACNNNGCYYRKQMFWSFSKHVAPCWGDDSVRTPCGDHQNKPHSSASPIPTSKVPSDRSLI